MKRITAIVLSALLLVTTFLSVPFITMAETPEAVNVDVDFSESFYTLNEVSSAVTTQTPAPINWFTLVTDPDAATAAEHGTVISMVMFRKLNSPDYDWYNTSKCAANVVFPVSEPGSKMLDVKSGTEYTVSFDVKVTSAASDVSVELFSNPADNYSNGANIRPGGVNIANVSKTQSTWRTVTTTYTAPNDGDLYLVVRSADNQFEGQAYFDNIKITEVVNTTAKYYTDVDFTETIWDGTSATQVGATIADGIAKFHRYGAFVSGNNQSWLCAAIRLPDNSGTSGFAVKAGVTYQVSYRIKINKLFGSFTVRGFTIGSNASFGNAWCPFAKTLSTEGTTTDWVTRTAEYTPSADGDMSIILLGAEGQGNWDDMGEIYIDDIKVSIKNNITYANVTDTTGLPTTILASDKYEDVLPALTAENFGGWYLDAQCTTPATGIVDAKGGVTVYAKYYDYTSIDFSESFYKDATYADLAYTYEQGTYSGNKGVACYVDLKTDAVKGDVVKFKKISATSNGNAERWPNIIRIADANGTAPFIVKPGKKYIVSYDVNAVTASSSFDICLTSITEYNGLSDIKATATYFPYVAVNTESGATNGWVTRQNIVFTPSWDYESQLCLIIRKNGGTAYNDQEIYFDNITICEATTLTVNKNNGEAAQELTVSPFATFDSLATPSNPGYEFEGWYLDKELTVPATGKICNTTAVWAKYSERSATNIDFNESVYTSGNSFFVYTAGSIAKDYNGTGDNALKFSEYRSKWQGWNSAVIMVDNTDTAAYKLVKGAQYIISYDMKVVKADEAFNVYMYATNNTSDIRINNGTATPHQVIASIPATSGETTYTRRTFVYTAPESANAVLGLISQGGTDMTNQEIYFDNISIEKVATQKLTLHLDNGQADKVIDVTQLTDFSTIQTPTKEGYSFLGWYTDSALSNAATGMVGSVTDIYAKWMFIPSVNVIDFNEPVYKNSNNFFIYNSSLAENLNGSGNNAALLTMARHPGQGWHTAVRLADAAGTGAYQMVSGQAYTIKFSYRVDYAERPHSLYIWVGANSNNLRPEDGKKLASFPAMTDYGDGQFNVTETGIFVAPTTGTVHMGFVADAYPDMADQKIYLDDITIERLDTPDVTLHLNNGEADKTVKVTLIDKLFSINAPVWAGHTFEGWFTDSALTQPFGFSGLSSDTFNTKDLYAKWSTTPTVGYEFETGFEAGETGAYTNNGSDSDKSNNYQNKDSYIDTAYDNANTGNGVVVMENPNGEYVSDSTHWMATALADKDGKYFQVVKGTRYRVTYSVLLTGNSSGQVYTGIATSDNVPSGAINANRIVKISNHGSGGTDLTHFDIWYNREVYFIAKETGKVYLWANTASAEQIVCYDDVKFEIADPDKTALIEYYNEDGTPYINGMASGNIQFTTFGACGEWITEGGYPPQQSKTGYVFNGWRIGSPTGKQFVSNRYPDEDIKLYASWVVAKELPENPTTPLDDNDSIVLDFEDTNATRAFYERGGNATGGYFGLYMVTNDPNKAHSGSNYYQYRNVGHWMKQWYRTMRFFNAASPDGKIWVEPNTTYKISYWYNPDKVGASNLYLANFSSDYADGYEILAENYLADANIFDQFGKWNYYETTVFTGDFKGELGFVLYGGYFTVAIDDITVSKCKEIEVNFQSNGGSEIDKITGMSHHTFIAPEDPTREGYTFAGWFTDAALTKPFDFTKDIVNKAMTLYAKWEPKKYKTVVTYEEKEVEVEVTPDDAHLDDAASFNDTKDKIGSIAGDVIEQPASLTWLWILLACVGGAVVLAGATILIIVLVKRKKKEA